ncbi:substrate import-associated zinc metallohydrolase lipoprotein [Myroides sp. WP-1]|uniref:substrate import-associated zinc metallohydrolase lipoprotein n=1 Tax=Myroides sp. WP-1 TaxID=2759944 RepID=UPI0015FC4261|nr:substrate import-associated zinc metallohydrolase lipoprotein [Myroides sp. WP-1]MBB1138801.1 hypothetical protein [Myroides sp. WP-1]
MNLYKNLKKIGFLSLVGLALVGCENDNDLGPSGFDLSAENRNELDQWIYDNYTVTYNIAATYKWNQAFGYYDKVLFPPKQENVKPALQMVKKIWLDSYAQAAKEGDKLVKRIAPRQFHLIGSYNVNNDNTITLGEAGGGARITLFNTDYVKHDDLASIRQFVHTVQHEYVHILNQTKDFDRVAWAAISRGGLYTSSWYLYDDEESNEVGFVTSYARSNYDEDFAETASFILMKTKVEWEEFLAGIKSPSAKADILAKVDLVVSYYQEHVGTDFWELRDRAEQNTNDVLNGNF